MNRTPVWVVLLVILLILATFLLVIAAIVLPSVQQVNQRIQQEKAAKNSPHSFADPFVTELCSVEVESLQLKPDKKITVQIRVRNLTKTKRLTTLGWRAYSTLVQPDAAAFDEHDNSYYVSSNETKNQTLDLAPGESGLTFLEVERPIPQAEYLVLKLDSMAVKSPGQFYFKLPIPKK